MLVKNKYPLDDKNRNHIQFFSDISYSFLDQYLMFIGIQKMNKNYLKKLNSIWNIQLIFDNPVCCLRN